MNVLATCLILGAIAVSASAQPKRIYIANGPLTHAQRLTHIETPLENLALSGGALHELKTKARHWRHEFGFETRSTD